MAVTTDIYDEPLAYRSAEIGPDGTVNLFRVVDLLQETAGKHADRLGFGMEDLGNSGTTWALTKLHVKLHVQLIGGQSYTVQTWPSGTNRLWAMRRYRILDSYGTEVGQAISHWMILDKETHRPQRLPESITGRIWPDPPAHEPNWIQFRDATELSQRSSDFDVRMTEIDINNHVNNAHYLAWVMNESASFTHQKWTAYEAEVIFEAETKLGDVVRILSEYHEVDHSLTTSHHIHRVDPPARVARVHIQWRNSTN
jgi:medium-chain acyl-[acyl-carrier-protein] hydrolase